MPLLTSVLLGCLPCQGAIILTQFTFDDFETPYSTPSVGEAAVQPGILEVTATNPRVETLDTITTGDTAGATRFTSLVIDPSNQIGDVTVFMASASGALPPRLSLNTDFFTAGTLVTEYDYSSIGGAVDVTANATHLIVDLVSTDNRDVGLVLTFTDSFGNEATVDISTIVSEITGEPIDLRTPGQKVLPFDTFAPVRFDSISGMKIEWEAGTGYDGEMALIGAGVVLDPVPESSSALLVLLGSALLVTRRRRERD